MPTKLIKDKGTCLRAVKSEVRFDHEAMESFE